MFCEGIEDQVRHMLSNNLAKHVQKTSKTYLKLVQDGEHFLKLH